APRTGLWEPGSEPYDRSALQSMIDETTVLALAGYLTREAKYFARARALLRAYLPDREPRMNPHLRYAQVRRGHDGDEGTASGIIDAKDLYYLLDAARLLETEEALPPREAEALREWFDQFRSWLVTSRQGREACASTNNRGTWYDVLVAAISVYLSDVRGALRTLRRAPARMAAQIAPDGSQPLELERALPAHYCAYNLQGWVALGYIARGVGAEIWSYRPPSGPGVADACRWILRADHEWTDARRAEDFDDERLAVLAHEAALMDPSTDLVDALRPDQRGPWSVRQRFTATEGIRPYWVLARREAREPVEINLADIVRKRAAAAPATRHADVDQNGFDAREGDAAPAPADGRRPPSRDRGVVAAISQKVLRNRDAVMYLALGLTYRQERFDEVVGMIDDFVRPPTKEEDAPLPLREALVESVRETLAAVGFPDVRIGITGGMDSRLLYAALRQIYEPDQIGRAAGRE